MDLRTSGAIALRPSGNNQGGHYFLSLHTGKRILRNNWTVLPMPNDMVDAIHRLAAASKQAGGITFMDRNSNILTDDDDEDETEEAEEDEPIPVADDIPMADENYNIITHNNNEEIINEQQENDTITGVHENEQNDNTNDNATPQHDPEDTHDNTQTTPEEEKNESDKYVTIEDINITSEMNTSNRESNKFGQESPLTTCRRKVLEYPGKVKFSMYEYIEKMLKELPTNMEGLATTPASSYLFNTDPGCKKLCEEQGQLFHHLVAKLLYLSKHTRQDTGHTNCSSLLMH